MRTVAIICEYNPFHLGHKIQIDAIRAKFPDESVCIVALMSGSYVQRGGTAILSPADRTSIALEMGVDLVLELPFPWSMSGADYFARGAVSILESLGSIDYLCFGSESGDFERMSRDATRLISPKYRDELDGVARIHPMLSWAHLRELAYLKAFGEELQPYKPNDLLGVAYLTHLKTIKPLVIKRKAGYSASLARKSFAQGYFSVLATLVPRQIYDALQEKYERAEKRDCADVALLSSLRLMSQSELASYAESTVELAGLITHNLTSVKTVEELVAACTNKKYTASRVRRALWHIFLRTPAEIPSSDPAYTRLLGCNSVGRQWISSIRKTSRIPLITRISNVRDYPEAEKQYLFSEQRSALLTFLTDDTEKNLPIVK